MFFTRKVNIDRMSWEEKQDFYKKAVSPNLFPFLKRSETIICNDITSVVAKGLKFQREYQFTFGKLNISVSNTSSLTISSNQDYMGFRPTIGITIEEDFNMKYVVHLVNVNSMKMVILSDNEVNNLSDLPKIHSLTKLLVLRQCEYLLQSGDKSKVKEYKKIHSTTRESL